MSNQPGVAQLIYQHVVIGEGLAASSIKKMALEYENLAKSAKNSNKSIEGSPMSRVLTFTGKGQIKEVKELDQAFKAIGLTQSAEGKKSVRYQKELRDALDSFKETRGKGELQKEFKSQEKAIDKATKTLETYRNSLESGRNVSGSILVGSKGYSKKELKDEIKDQEKIVSQLKEEQKITGVLRDRVIQSPAKQAENIKTLFSEMTRLADVATGKSFNTKSFNKYIKGLDELKVKWKDNSVMQDFYSQQQL